MSKTRDWLNTFRDTGQRIISQKVKTIAVLSGKGGVGKTSYSLRLANDLSKSNKKVLLIDCDYNLSNTLLKLNTNTKSRFVSYLEREANLYDCMVKIKNFHLLPTCNGNIEVFDKKFRIQNEIINIVDQCEKHYDFIILDCPAGIAKETLNLAAFCDLRLIMITPDKSSLADSYALTKILIQRYGSDLNRFVLNKVRDETVFNKVSKTFHNTCLKFMNEEAYFLGYLPYLDVNPKYFDQDFIFGENNSLKENCLRITQNLYEIVFEASERLPSSLLDSTKKTDEEIDFSKIGLGAI